MLSSVLIMHWPCKDGLDVFLVLGMRRVGMLDKILKSDHSIWFDILVLMLSDNKEGKKTRKESNI